MNKMEKPSIIKQFEENWDDARLDIIMRLETAKTPRAFVEIMIGAAKTLNESMRVLLDEYW